MKYEINFPKYETEINSNTIIPFIKFEIDNGMLFCKASNSIFLLNVEFSQRYFNEYCARLNKHKHTENEIIDLINKFFQQYI